MRQSPPSSHGNTIGTWSALLMDALAASGVRDVIVSPGSRSTPFVLAAARQDGLRIRSTIDERSAAFQAVGMAKVTERPVVLLCTSGTAPAHYLPAVIEASLSFVPLIVLTADRPLSLQECGAPQTVDQVKLFGDHMMWFADLGDPCLDPGPLRALGRMAAQAVWRCQYPTPGPVHLNARARKPLEPGPATTEEERAAAEHVLRVRSAPIARAPIPEVRASSSTCDELGRMIRAAERGVILCGPAPLSQRRARSVVFEFAEKTGFPLLAEATSQLRFAHDRGDVVAFDAFDSVLHAAWAQRSFRPDLIVQLGAAPTSSAWGRWSEQQEGPRVVIAPHGWQDPHSNATHLVSAPIAPTLQAIAARIDGPIPRSDWQAQVARWESEAWASADSLIDANHLDEAGCARALLQALPDGALLGVGNSLPIRMLDTWCRGKMADVAVWSQRGANGIDGVVSGMAGAARAWKQPAALLIGDVSFVHDLGGLAAARDLTTPLVLLVVNNDGGRIFEQLPIARVDGIEDCFELWTTPPRVDLAHAAASFGLRHRRVKDVVGLRSALSAAVSNAGCSVIEAVVPPSEAFTRNKALWNRLEELGP